MNERHIGFTGTKVGMSEHQKESLWDFLIDAITNSAWRGKIVLHHGDCIGADADAHKIALSLGCGITIHPPIKRIKRAYCQGANEVLPPGEYLDRNHRIMDACMGLIAAPKSNEEELRSATWATVRYARKTKQYYSVFPSQFSSCPGG